MSARPAPREVLEWCVILIALLALGTLTGSVMGVLVAEVIS